MGGKRAENVKLVRLALRAVVASAHSSCGQSYVPSEWRARASARCLLPYAALPHAPPATNARETAIALT